MILKRASECFLYHSYMSFLIHSSLESGRWNTFTLAFQLANVGSDFGRALRGKIVGDNARMWSALERCLELLDLTIADPKHRKRLKELCRLREVIGDFLIGENEYQSTGESLDRYFLEFTVEAQKERESLRALVPAKTPSLPQE